MYRPNTVTGVPVKRRHGRIRSDVILSIVAIATFSQTPVCAAIGEWIPRNEPSPGWANQPGVVSIAGDFDGNGRSDVAFHRPGSSWATVPVVFSRGNGAWAPHNKSAPSWANQAGVVAVPGDYNGDGRTDVAFHRPMQNSGWKTVPVLLSNGDGSWTPQNKSAPTWAHGSGVVAIRGEFESKWLQEPGSTSCLPRIRGHPKVQAQNIRPKPATYALASLDSQLHVPDAIRTCKVFELFVG